MSTPRVAHIFEYRWWRLQEGLTHREVVPDWQGVATIAARKGSYIYYNGVWFKRCVAQPRMHLTTVMIDANKVPKEVRTLCLILT